MRNEDLYETNWRGERIIDVLERQYHAALQETDPLLISMTEHGLREHGMNEWADKLHQRIEMLES